MQRQIIIEAIAYAALWDNIASWGAKWIKLFGLAQI
jgi:hypothetical protein